MMEAPENRRRIGVSLALAGLLAGCSGGSDGLTEPGYRTGVFAGGPVAGLSYETESFTGVTNSKGEFHYQAGETIRFSVGGVAIGQAVPGKSHLSPIDVVPGARAYRTVPEVRMAIDQQDRSLYTLTNILVFLQTFDDDGDSSKINISGGVAELLADARIDFTVEPAAFHQNLTLRFFTYKAARDGLIPTSSPRKAGDALDRFYASEGLTHAFSVPQVIRTDIGNDGIVDLRVQFSLDDNGNPLAFTFQTLMDGMLQNSAIEQWTVNANGDGVWHSADAFNDEEPAQVGSTTYDEYGDPAVIRIAVGGGVQSTTKVSRDEDGNETRSLDRESNGTQDSISVRKFDARGLLIFQTEDLNADDIADVTRRLSHDSAGVLAMERLESDNDADGDLDSIRETLFNDRGQPTMANVDFNGDGEIDSMESWDYDAAGRLVLQTRNDPLTDVTTVLARLEYDDGGRLIHLESTSELVHSWTYDEDGVLLQSVTECPNCLIRSVTTSQYRYDAAARRTTLDTETYLAGTFANRSLSVYEYDEVGALKTLLQDDSADGTWDLRVEYDNQPGDWSSVLDTRIDQPPSFTSQAYYD